MINLKLTNLLRQTSRFVHTHPKITIVIGIFVLIVFVGLVFYYFQYKKNGTFDKMKIINVLTLSALSLLIVFFIVLKRNSPRANDDENLALTNTNYIFGIDISHNQGDINWQKFKQTKHPIKFVFIRATMGANSKDRRFNEYWNHLKETNYLIGAYHYYRPNENSSAQFENFKEQVDLATGNLIPVLDIERQSAFGNENLKLGLRNWLTLAERHFGVKPIIYTGHNFYTRYLQNDFDDYPLWIAAYDKNTASLNLDCHFHQFSERIRIKGIDYPVDGNNFKGSLRELQDKFRLN